jgi:predicted ATPase
MTLAPPAAKQNNHLKALTIAGYKSFDRATTVELGGLTVLAGINSGGKSSLIQPLLLLKQTLESDNDPGALKIDGPNVHFSELDQFFSRPRTKIQKALERLANSFGTLSFGLRFDTVFETFEFAGQDRSLQVLRNKIERDGNTAVLEGSSASAKTLLASVRGDGGDSEFLDRLTKRVVNLDAQIPLVRERFRLLPADSVDLDTDLRFAFLVGHKYVPSVIDEWLKNLIHVPGLRGLPERNYRVIGVGERFTGRFEDHTASVIKRWQDDKDAHILQVGDALERLGLTWQVQAKTLNAANVDLQIARMPRTKTSSADLVSVADVGFGVSQVMPVIVALIAATSKQAVYIEQPEIHLHPRAQAVLAELIVEAVARDVQVIVETHSSILLVSLQALIAEQKIAHQDVKLHWVARDKHGSSIVTTAVLDADGAYGDWPVDFDTTAEQANLRYLKATVLKD